MAYDFGPMDADLIDTFGKEVLFFTDYPDESGAELVTIIPGDATLQGETAQPAFLVLFGTMDRSGFSQLPAKNSNHWFRIDEVDYRVFEVKGPDAAGGITISLTR